MSSLRPTIVVVDDSEIVLAVTEAALIAAGYRVITRNRPTGCVAMMLQEMPDLVLLDVSMPGVSGDTLVKLFASADPQHKAIVLLHSSLDEEALSMKARASGADGYIRKSEDPALLVRQVNRWLGRRFLGSSGALALRESGSSGRSRQSSDAQVESSRRPESLSHSLPSSRVRLVNPPTVLFVDDDMLVLSGYRRLVQAEDVEVEFALSGAQALNRILSSSPPDVVVCDLLMPEPAGAQVFSRAFEHDRTWGERFVVATGAGSDALAELPHFTGPTLQKPVEGAALLGAIRRCLSSPSASASARR